MSTTTLTFNELDTDATILEAHAKRLHVAVMKGWLALLCTVLMCYLYRSRVHVNRLRRILSNLDIRTPEDRAHLREGASRLAAAAKTLNATFDLLQKRRAALHVPWVGAPMMRSLESLICAVEDVAETAALGASQDFATVVRSEIAKLDTHVHRRVTA